MSLVPLEFFPMVAATESYRRLACAFQVLNFEHFASELSPYAIASDDFKWIDFAVSTDDRLAYSRDVFFQSMCHVESALSEADETSVPIESQILREIEDLIQLVQSARCSNGKGSPEHLPHSKCKTDQILQSVR